MDIKLGIDISSDMLDEARDKVKNAKVICADVTHNPDLVEGKFNFVSQAFGSF